MNVNGRLARAWRHVGPRFLPFADAASPTLPLPRLLRLSLFQVSVGMAIALLVGTLNRVMIVELGVPAWLVAAMVALPVLFAPLRTLVGFRSDTHRSHLGWKRVPYLWFGTLLQFGGLAIMPFALLVLSGGGQGPAWVGLIGAALAFLLVGAGLHTTQTAGLALATDLAPEATRPRVVALMFVMLLVGMTATSVAFGLLLTPFGPLRLVQVIQGAAVVTIVLNGVALWKQEARNPAATRHDVPRPDFASSWRSFVAEGTNRRYLVALGLGSAAFSMQDIVLEPYGGEVLHLPVGATSMLTALLATGALVAFGLAARQLQRGSDPHRLAASGALVGIAAFAAVIFAAPLGSELLFRAGCMLIGFGGGLFSVAMLTVAMGLERPGRIGLEGSEGSGRVALEGSEGSGRVALEGSEGSGRIGLAIGAWGAVQATCSGLAIALGGALRDGVGGLATRGALGEAMSAPAVGYSVVYHLEILLLFVTLVALGPLVRSSAAGSARPHRPFGLAEFPG